jgi:hypothetical protein
MHTVVYKYGPKSFLETWQTNSDRDQPHDLRNHERFKIPFLRIDLFKKSPYYSLLIEWNKLDDNRLQSNKTTFQFEIKNKLLEELTD